MESPHPAKGKGGAEAGGGAGPGRLKRCPYCGAKNKTSFEYCVRCSEPLDESSPEGAIAQTRSRLNLLVVAGAAAVVALAILALVRPSPPEAGVSSSAEELPPPPDPPVRVTPVPDVDAGPAMASYNAGLAAYGRRDYRTAVSEFEKAVAQIPENPGAHAYLGMSHYFLEDYEDAIPALEEALALRPSSFAYLDYLVTSCKKAGDPGRAAVVLRDFVAANPREVEARIELGRLTRDSGDVEESLRVTSALREEFADDAELAYEHAATLQAAGRTQEAADTLRAALSVAPDEPRVHHALGVIALSSGNPRGAVESFEAAVARAPSNGDYLFDLAQAYEKGDRIEESLSTYERYLQHARSDDSRARVVAERLEVAKEALARERRNEAGRGGPGSES